MVAAAEGLSGEVAALMQQARNGGQHPNARLWFSGAAAGAAFGQTVLVGGWLLWLVGSFPMLVRVEGQALGWLVLMSGVGTKQS